MEAPGLAGTGGAMVAKRKAKDVSRGVHLDRSCIVRALGELLGQLFEERLRVLLFANGFD